jgi:hypothetical protein
VQTFTDEQKAQARANIGAVAADEVSSLVSDVVQYTSQSLTDAQKAQARINISAAPEYTYGTKDVTAGSTSPYATGTLHFVYEAG